MSTSQLTDLTPESATNLFGLPISSEIDITKAEAVRAARAAVAASLQPENSTKPVGPPVTGVLCSEVEFVSPTVPFEVRFANLQKGISQLAAAGIGSM